MRARLAALVVPVRLARRELWRRPGRTALIVALVAIPTFGMATASSLIRTEAPGTVERFRSEHGGADVVVDAAMLDVVPAGIRTAVVRSAVVRVRGPAPTGRTMTARDRTFPLFDDRSARAHRILEGRLARAGDEVALTAAAAHAVEARVGDTVTVGPAPSGHRTDEPPADAWKVRVVGIVEHEGCLSCPEVLVAAGAALPAAEADQRATAYLAVDDEAAVAELAGSASAGVLAQPELAERLGSMVGAQEAGARVRWAVVIGTVVLTAGGIVVAAALAVGARRQLCTLGQLAAAGAAPGVLRRCVVLQGSLAGGIGVVTGLTAAPVALLAAQGWIESALLDHRVGRWRFEPTDLAVIAVVGLFVATLAAVVPARTAARVPIVAALAGRRPLAPVPVRVPVVGVGVIAAGLGLLFLAVVGASSGRAGDLWAYTAITGGVLQLFGACALAPALVSCLEPLAGRLRGSWRLGARSLARNRSRTGAVVAAVAVTGALAVFGGGMVEGLELRQPNHIWVDLPPEVAVLFVEVPQALTGRDGVETYAGEPVGPASGDPEPGICQQRTCLVSSDGETLLLAPPVCEVRACWVGPDDSIVVLPKLCEHATCTVEQSGAVVAHIAAPPDRGLLDAATALVPGARAAALSVVPIDPSGLTAVVRHPDDGPGGPGLELALTYGVVVDRPLLDAFGLSGEARRALEDHGMVVAGRFGTSGEPDGTVTVVLPDGSSQQVPAVPAGDLGGITEAPPGRIAEVVLTAERARSLGVGEPTAIAAVLRAPKALTAEQRRSLEDLGAETGGILQVRTRLAAEGTSAVQIQAVLVGISVTVALVVIGAALALAAAESRDEREVLATVGARPGDLARAAGVKAALMAGLGGLMAVPLGMLPVAVVAASLTAGMPVRPPLLTIALLAIVVPALAGLIAAGASRAGQQLRPVRVSTATFEQ